MLALADRPFRYDPSAAVASTVTVAVPPSTCTCGCKAPPASVPVDQPTACDQKRAKSCQETQSLAHWPLASDVQAITLPSPYCHCASTGSPASDTSAICPPAFGDVPT